MRPVIIIVLVVLPPEKIVIIVGGGLVPLGPLFGIINPILLVPPGLAFNAGHICNSMKFNTNLDQRIPKGEKTQH